MYFTVVNSYERLQKTKLSRGYIYLLSDASPSSFRSLIGKVSLWVTTIFIVAKYFSFYQHLSSWTSISRQNAKTDPKKNPLPSNMQHPTLSQTYASFHLASTKISIIQSGKEKGKKKVTPKTFIKTKANKKAGNGSRWLATFPLSANFLLPNSNNRTK